MKLEFSDYFKNKLKKKIKQNPKIRIKIHKQLKLLEVDFHYPSLKTHKLKGKRLDQYAIWIEGNIRITFIVVESTILLTDIITHDEY